MPLSLWPRDPVRVILSLDFPEKGSIAGVVAADPCCAATSPRRVSVAGLSAVTAQAVVTEGVPYETLRRSSHIVIQGRATQ